MIVGLHYNINKNDSYKTHSTYSSKVFTRVLYLREPLYISDL